MAGFATPTFAQSPSKAASQLREVTEFEIHGFLEAGTNESIERLDLNKLSSVIYGTVRAAPANADNDSVLDASGIIPANLHRLRDRARTTGTKVRIRVAGSPGEFTAESMPPDRLKKFADALRNYLDQHQLDGIVVDLQAPDTPDEREAFVNLAVALKVAFDLQPTDFTLGSWAEETGLGSGQYDRVHFVYTSGNRGQDHGSLTEAHKTLVAIIKAGFPINNVLLELPLFGVKGPERLPRHQLQSLPGYAPSTDEISGWKLSSEHTLAQRIQFALNNDLRGVVVRDLNDDPSGRLLDLIYEDVTNPRPHSRQTSKELTGIGINFIGGSAHSLLPTPLPMRPDESAGLAIQSNWNSLSGAYGNNMELTDASGQPTGAKAHFQAHNTYRMRSKDHPGNRRMMVGYLDTSNESEVSIEVSNIPYDDYCVLVYHDGDNSTDGRTARYSLATAGGLVRSIEVADPANWPYPTGYLDHASRHSVFGVLRGEKSFRLHSKGIEGRRNVLRAPVNGIQIIDMTNRINLADIVGGGNGMGSGSAQGLSAGNKIRGLTSSVVGDAESTFPDLVPVQKNNLIDGIFTPQGGADNAAAQTLDSTGNEFSFGSESGSIGSNLSIFNGAAGIGDPGHSANAGIVFDDVISFGAQHGVTFDLEAIRNQNNSEQLTAFSAVFGENRNSPGGTVSGFVFIDGELVRKISACSDTEHFLHVKIGPNDRFLTLAATDSGDGNDSDLAYFANAYLLYEPNQPSAFSQLFIPRNILIFFGITAIGAFIALAVMRIHHQKRLRTAAQKQALADERSRIARDMHDEAGAMLTRISVLSQLGHDDSEADSPQSELLRTISDASKEAVRQFDQIVWAINPRNDTLEQFSAYFADYATKYFESTGVTCELNLPRELPDIPLTSKTRQNMLRAAEEAMSNALKHSGAAKVRVHLELEGNRFQILVADDGTGFTEDHGKPNSNGIRSMRKRMDSVGGECMMTSNPDSGTTVLFSIPLNYAANSK